MRFLSRKNRFFELHYRTKRNSHRFNQVTNNQELINIYQYQKITNVFKIRQLQKKVH